MNVAEFGIELDLETDVGPDIFALTSADLQPAEGDGSDPKADTTAVGGDKPE